MTQATAAAAIVLALAVGFYGARWRQRENGLRAAKTQLDGAIGQVWKARKTILIAAIAVLAMLEYWLHGRGR